jgi:acetoacetyl-CoA synthase
VLADGLRGAGVVAGDRVAGFVPNCPEAVIAMLAATSIGAIWSSCSPDFGVNGVLDRFNQIRPKILFAADGYCYGGKRIDCMPTLTELARRIDGLERVVVFPFLADVQVPDSMSNAMPWSEFVGSAQDIEFASLPFDHPVYVMYSSGTTGKPKCIVHGAGGTLLQHLKEHQLHSDLGRDDRFFFFTTCGWMMWNWLVSGLATGATIVLYDGSPFNPDPGSLWRWRTKKASRCSAPARSISRRSRNRVSRHVSNIRSTRCERFSQPARRWRRRHLITFIHQLRQTLRCSRSPAARTCSAVLRSAIHWAPYTVVTCNVLDSVWR